MGKAFSYQETAGVKCTIQPYISAFLFPPPVIMFLHSLNFYSVSRRPVCLKVAPLHFDTSLLQKPRLVLQLMGAVSSCTAHRKTLCPRHSQFNLYSLSASLRSKGSVCVCVCVCDRERIYSTGETHAFVSTHQQVNDPSTGRQ